MFANPFTVADLRDIDHALWLTDESASDPLRRKVAALLAALDPPSPSELAAQLKAKADNAAFAAHLDALLHPTTAPTPAMLAIEAAADEARRPAREEAAAARKRLQAAQDARHKAAELDAAREEMIADPGEKLPSRAPLAEVRDAYAVVFGAVVPKVHASRDCRYTLCGLQCYAPSGNVLVGPRCARCDHLRKEGGRP